MSHIHAKNTKPEITLRKALFAKGFRYRINDTHLPGKPEIVLPKYKTVIFVHGCFWHGHDGCKDAYVPKSNTEFWINKVSHNKAHDVNVERILIAKGWRVLIVWECGIRHVHDIMQTVDHIVEKLLD